MFSIFVKTEEIIEPLLSRNSPKYKLSEQKLPAVTGESFFCAPNSVLLMSTYWSLVNNGVSQYKIVPPENYFNFNSSSPIKKYVFFLLVYLPESKFTGNGRYADNLIHSTY